MKKQTEDIVNNFAPEELENSTRIFKSATPKYTVDWYVKWVASIFILLSMSVRGVPEYQLLDLSFSVTGITLWLWVSIIWNDRALIILNGVGMLLLIRNLLGILI